MGDALTERYGPWGTVAGRLDRWRKAALWEQRCAAIQQHDDAKGQRVWDVHDVESTLKLLESEACKQSDV